MDIPPRKQFEGWVGGEWRLLRCPHPGGWPVSALPRGDGTSRLWLRSLRSGASPGLWEWVQCHHRLLTEKGTRGESTDKDVGRCYTADSEHEGWHRTRNGWILEARTGRGQSLRDALEGLSLLASPLGAHLRKGQRTHLCPVKPLSRWELFPATAGNESGVHNTNVCT